MYLEHFKFEESPFTLTPNTQFFCHLKGHQEALNTLLFSLRSGEGFIKIIGEVGSGKTLLCRKLLESLNEEFVTAYIPNPDLNPIELRRALARELGIDPLLLHDQHELLTRINHRLLELHGMGKKVVLLLDEAQALPLESLEAVRLLTNLETEKTKLLQVVLFGQPELDDHLSQNNFRQLKQRITFSCFLPKMSRDELDTYLFHRLATAGSTCGTLFTQNAKNILYEASKGIPRLVNILCHKALLVAYGQGEAKVDKKIMQSAIQDTEAVAMSDNKLLILVSLGLILLIGLVFTFYFVKGII
jgi:MSHA biogenesis protein MshM